MPRNYRSNDYFTNLLKLLDSESASHPMPAYLSDRIREYIYMGVQDRGCSTRLNLYLPQYMLNYLQQVAGRDGTKVTEVARGIIMFGLSVMRVSEEAETPAKAADAMKRALDLAQHLSPADRRYARERLIDIPRQQDPKDNPRNDPQDMMPGDQQ
jgi:hypothetical protein